jgi:hypothetical protein
MISSNGPIEAETYEPVLVSVKQIKSMLKNNTWKGSMEQEEVEYNISNNLYPKKYTKEVKKLLGL